MGIGTNQIKSNRQPQLQRPRPEQQLQRRRQYLAATATIAETTAMAITTEIIATAIMAETATGAVVTIRNS